MIPGNKKSREINKQSELVIRDLYNTYTREENCIWLSEVLQLLLDKNLMSNRVNFEFIFDIYFKTVAEESLMNFTNFLEFIQNFAY